MKWNISLRHWLRSQKSGGHVNTPVFSSAHAGIRARCRCPSTIKDGLGYKLRTGKKIVTWHFFTHGTFKSSQEVVETCPCVPDRNGIWKKPLGARTRTNIKLNPHTCMASTPGFEPGQHWWEASALTTAPLRIFVSSGAVHCFVAAAKLKFQTGHWPSCQRKPGKMLTFLTLCPVFSGNHS